MSTHPTPDPLDALAQALAELDRRVTRLEIQVGASSLPARDRGEIQGEITSISSSIRSVIESLDGEAVDDTPGPPTDEPVVDLSESRSARRSRPAGWQPVAPRRS